jgi:hypothetical protein
MQERYLRRLLLEGFPGYDRTRVKIDEVPKVLSKEGDP